MVEVTTGNEEYVLDTRDDNDQITEDLTQLSADELLAKTTLSYSRLKLLSQSSGKYYKRYIQRLKTEQTEASALGVAAHALLLEPQTFEDKYLVMPKPDRRTTVGKTAYAAATLQAQEENKIILFDKQLETCLAICRSVQRHPHASRYLNTSLRELELNWTDPITQLPAKAYLDAYHEELEAIVDVKLLTGKFNPYKFAYKAKEECYHVQAGFYKNGCVLNKLKVKEVVYILVSAADPDDVAVCRADAEFVERGQVRAESLAVELVSRIRDNDWESYRNVIPLGYVPW